MVLGIDLGAKTTGLAISHGQIATSYKTITHKDQQSAVSQVVDICNKEGIDKVILGFVEGKIKKMFTDFASALKKQKPEIKVILWDETLTSLQAGETMIKLQMSKTRRRQKEHEYAAAVILQSYLDSDE